MRKLIFIFLLVLLVIGMALAADTPESSPVKSAEEKVDDAMTAVKPTPLEMYRNLEAQQAQVAQDAQKLRVEYEQRMENLKALNNQCEGAKKMLLILYPTLEEELKPKVIEIPAERSDKNESEANK